MKEREMNPRLWLVLILVGSLWAMPRLCAQSSPPTDGAGASQNKQAAPQSGSNPFPEDTSNVPVMPSGGTATQPDGTGDGAGSGEAGNGGPGLTGEDSDPVRSPDDAASTPESSSQESSSLSGLDKLLPTTGDDQTDNRKKLNGKEPEHQETAAEDLNVGGYYLEKKNWKAALSRFQSALVLDPENPDVYWGLAESERNLGQLADARAHYQKVFDYDPDSKHGKEARKALREPEIANAKSAPTAQPGSDSAKQ